MTTSHRMFQPATIAEDLATGRVATTAPLAERRDDVRYAMVRADEVQVGDVLSGPTGWQVVTGFQAKGVGSVVIALASGEVVTKRRTQTVQVQRVIARDNGQEAA